MAVIKRAVNKWLSTGRRHGDGHKLYDSSTKSSRSASDPGAEPDEPDQLTPSPGSPQSVSAEIHVQVFEDTETGDDDEFVIMDNMVQIQVVSEEYLSVHGLLILFLNFSPPKHVSMKLLEL